MENRGGEFHLDTDEARAGSTPHVVRWMLGVGLVLAIVLLSLIWITGAVGSREDARVSNIGTTANSPAPAVETPTA
jgi:hypothetical protein